jgi:hypothetical protein
MPLGSGYSAEEQITGEAEHGGIQIIVYPIKQEIFEKRFPKRTREFEELPTFLEGDTLMSMEAGGAEMELAPGGRIRQEIYKDPFKLSDWDIDQKSRCFVHLTNSLVWRAITGDTPQQSHSRQRNTPIMGCPGLTITAIIRQR